MAKKKEKRVRCVRVELGGVRYAILREAVFEDLCRRAHVSASVDADQEPGLAAGFDLDQESLAERLVQRRRGVGLSQAELARRAGIRAETLNRIERGRTTPDFATIRKLVVAIQAAEQQRVE